MQSFVLYMFFCGVLVNLYILYKFSYSAYISWKFK